MGEGLKRGWINEHCKRKGVNKCITGNSHPKKQGQLQQPTSRKGGTWQSNLGSNAYSLNSEPLKDSFSESKKQRMML